MKLKNITKLVETGVRWQLTYCIFENVTQAYAAFSIITAQLPSEI